jgi:hypothetical protein
VIWVWKQQAIERSHRLDLTGQDDKERQNLVSDLDEHLTGRDRTPSAVRGDS